MSEFERVATMRKTTPPSVVEFAGEAGKEIARLQHELGNAQQQAILNGHTVKAQQEKYSAESSSLHKLIGELRSERNALYSENLTFKRERIDGALSARLIAFVLENLHEIVVETPACKLTTLGALCEDGSYSAAGRHSHAIIANLVRTRGRDLPRRLCIDCSDLACAGCDESSCEFRLPVQLREALRERRT